MVGVFFPLSKGEFKNGAVKWSWSSFFDLAVLCCLDWPRWQLLGWYQDSFQDVTWRRGRMAPASPPQPRRTYHHRLQASSFLPPSWIIGEPLALLVLWFMLHLQVCSLAVPLLSCLSLPQRRGLWQQSQFFKLCYCSFWVAKSVFFKAGSHSFVQK